VFPVYWLARHLRLSVLLSALVSLAAGMNPYTLYSATYMSESLQYPMLLWAAWTAVRWLEAPRIRPSLQLGLLLGIMAMIRYATGTFVIALSVAALIACFTDRSGQRWTQRLMQLMTVLAVYGAFQTGWWGFKVYHGASALGAYASNLKTLPHGSLVLFGAYMGDALFAAGPLTAGVCLAGIRFLRRDRPSAAVFLATVTAFLVITTAIFDGGLTGELRGRFYIYVLPLLSMLAVFGAADLKTGHGVRTFLGLFLPALASVVLVFLYARSATSLAGTPWADVFGLLHVVGLGAFSAGRMLLWAVGLAGVCSLLIAMRLVRPEFVVAGSAILLNTVALPAYAQVLRHDVHNYSVQLQPVLKAIPAELPAGSKVAVTGIPRGIPNPGRLGIMNRDLELTETLIFQLEIIRGLDVRVVNSETELSNPGLGSAFLLTASSFPQLPLLRESGGFHFYRLERRSLPLVSGTQWNTPAASFMSEVGEFRPDGAIHGTSKKRFGFLVCGPFRPLPLGEYEVIYHFRAGADLNYFGKIVGGGKVAWTGNLKGGEEKPVRFRVDAPGAAEFTIHGLNREDFVFRGVTLRQF